MDDEVVSVRIPKRDLEAIDRRVREGSFVNRSDLVRHAVRTYFVARDESAIEPLGALPAPVPRSNTGRRTPREVKR
ncbi:MAG TPA: ribbon-helix-helix domain-containing protein [Candidatus Thermoplasmatota archaeon]|nr:ribbon-helix-helix domain-containing protein [Candidatus Thermoplasmatota archaeon]